MCGCCCGKDAKEEEKGINLNPLRRRSCTDILFLIIFLLFIAGMIYIAAFSIVNGNARRLVSGYDSYGDTCDYDNTAEKLPNVTQSGKDLTGKKYVFYMNILYPRTSLSVCVSECPDTDMDTGDKYYEYTKRTGIKICNYDLPLDDYKQAVRNRKGPCPTEVYKSTPVLNRCLPSELSSLATDIQTTVIDYMNESDVFQKVLMDLYLVWKEVLGMCFLALIFASLMLLVIRYMAKIIVWVVLVLSVVGSIGGTALLWWTYVSYRNKINKEENMQIPILDVEVSNEKAFLTFSIIATVLTVILLLIIIVMRKRIGLTVALFQEAGKCIAVMPWLVLQPLWTFIILMAFFVYWIAVLAFLSTAGTPKTDPETGFVTYEDTLPVRSMWWYHMIGLIWISEFILACQELVIAGAVASWYFERNKKKVTCPIGKSVCRMISHHIGSAALGAFIITLVKFPRMVLMYLQKKMSGKQNECAKFCMKCCICCLWCLEKCLKFLNRNAYIVIAIEGTHFCAAARKAFMTLVANVLRVAAINSVGDFVLFLGKIGVMAASGAVGIAIFKTRDDLHYYAVPVLLICVFAFFVAHCFLSVYEMVIDTLLLCFCEDCNINDGTPGREYFMSSTLMEYVNNSSTALNTLTKKKTTAAPAAETQNLTDEPNKV